MKYLKKFDEEEKSIEDWCHYFKISNYEISSDGLVDVNCGVDISFNNLKSIYLKFGSIGGNFYCSDNKLTTLEGSPKRVEQTFSCSNNKLTTLEGSPIEVGKDFYCGGNKLVSLKGGTKEVGGDFWCDMNRLTSLEGSPSKIGHFSCGGNKIKSLIGCPKEVRLSFDCQTNLLISLDGCPEKIGGGLFCWGNPIWEIYKLFLTLERYQASMDYKYLRGTDIVRGRFKKACEDAEIKMPISIPGYKYIDL